jgi:hypothetical protein
MARKHRTAAGKLIRNAAGLLKCSCCGPACSGTGIVYPGDGSNVTVAFSGITFTDCCLNVGGATWTSNFLRAGSVNFSYSFTTTSSNNVGGYLTFGVNPIGPTILTRLTTATCGEDNPINPGLQSDLILTPDGQITYRTGSLLGIFIGFLSGSSPTITCQNTYTVACYGQCATSGSYNSGTVGYGGTCTVTIS